VEGGAPDCNHIYTGLDDHRARDTPQKGLGVKGSTTANQPHKSDPGFPKAAHPRKVLRKTMSSIQHLDVIFRKKISAGPTVVYQVEDHNSDSVHVSQEPTQAIPWRSCCILGCEVNVVGSLLLGCHSTMVFFPSD
jgi:hypothetical protein